MDGNLLTDPVLPVRTKAGRWLKVDLAQLLVSWADPDDPVVALLFLRPHQQPAFHQFVTQTSALALLRGNERTLDVSVDRWRILLRGLTREWPNDAPWRLHVAELDQPAFLQPPVPEADLAAFKNEIATPDDLDTLVTARNHGVKQGQAADAIPAAWIAALMSLQTTGGFLGAGNYGVARMNGGFATRPCIGLAPEGGPGARWQRDVRVLLAQPDWWADEVPQLGRRDRKALLWLYPWRSDDAPLPIEELDPLFVEICRRVRLVREADGRLVARTATTAAARVDGTPFKGNVGDPWIPVDTTASPPAAYNSPPRYKVMSEVLFGDGRWRRPLLLRWHAGIDAVPSYATFDVFVRGQGKTGGYHSREIRLHEVVVRKLARVEGRDELARLSKEMVENARDVEAKLRFALLVLFQGAPLREERLDGRVRHVININSRDKTSGAWAKKFVDVVDDEVDRRFFDHLFARVERGEPAALAWCRFLEGLAFGAFRRAVRAAPVPEARALKAAAVGENVLRGGVRKVLMALYPPKEAADAA